MALFKFKSRTEVEEYLRENSIELSDRYTQYPSLMTSFDPDYNKYDDMARTENMKQISKASALMIEDVLRSAAPTIAQIFFLCDSVVTSIYKFFQTNTDVKILAENYNKYLGARSKCEDKREIDVYNRALDKFRPILPRQIECRTLVGSVKTEIRVGRHVQEIKEMLRSMVMKRGQNLGLSGSGAEHMEEVITVLENSDFDTDILMGMTGGLKAKRKGRLLDEEGGEVEVYLVSTALVKLRQQDLDRYNLLHRKILEFDPETDTGTDNKLFLLECTNEADSIYGGGLKGTSGDAFEQQKSNIDPVFLAFFIPICILGVTYGDFPRYQRGIYNCCKSIRGKVNMGKTINLLAHLPGFGVLPSKLSKSVEMHLPPWVLNVSRMYDMAATIGGLDLAMPKVLNKPAISWRYFLGMKYSDNTDCFTFLHHLWAIEKLDTQEDIQLAERALQQLIMGRVGPLSNTNKITGNALNVKIVE